MMSKHSTTSYNEQLYIDARLDFAIKHPLAWQLRQLPTSSPAYRDDTVSWGISVASQEEASGEMLIRAFPGKPDGEPIVLLNAFLEELSPLGTTQTETLELIFGNAEKIIGQDDTQTRMIVALDGQQHNFIISFACPTDNFESLAPIFEEIVNSFVEILQPPAS